MQFYTFEMDESSKDLCTICTPFGNYRYNCLPMGIKQSPDIAQQIMEDVFRQQCDEVDVYIDDIGIFSNDWDLHLRSLDKVLSLLQDNHFTVNPLKCEWAVQETDWLGYWLTPTGLKPWKKKVQAILDLQPPRTIKELRSFIGAVTFYRDMFPKRSHLVAPLTEQSGRRNIAWTPACDAAFCAIKAMLAKDAFIRYPDHNKPFHVYTDASDLQLGSVIMPHNAPVAYFSRRGFRFRFGQS
jgi:RNase H-like domain found in reverse transcriptase/Reverse transcriptase (RNA-dependent DNA polymerase)